MDTEQLANGLKQTCIGNPFASPTEEVEGDDFVGRKSVLAEMHRDIVYPNKISNYHVVGLPRIGKSSLLKAFLYVLSVLRAQYASATAIILDPKGIE